MHLHQPDWKSGERTVDGGVDPGDHPDRADVPYWWWSWKMGQILPVSDGSCKECEMEDFFKILIINDEILNKVYLL